MNRISTVIATFVGYLCTCERVPHKKLKAFLGKLSQLARIENELDSEPTLQDLINELIKQESRLTGRDGLSLAVVLLKVIQQMFDKLTAQLGNIRKLQKEREALQKDITELEHLIDSLTVEGESSGAEKADVIDGDDKFNDILKHPKYVHHYRATHRDFMTPVIVVVWNADVSGPSIVHHGLPVVYVPLPGNASEEFASWGAPVQSSPATEQEIASAKKIIAIIKSHQARLFAEHSNLVAIRCGARGTDGELCIEFVVAGSGFKPLADRARLPPAIDGVATTAVHGWSEFCGKEERRQHRPLLPGAGIGVGTDAHYHNPGCEQDYHPPVLATLGGAYVTDGAVYGVTCGHCLQSGRTNGVLHPAGTPVYQPCAMGSIMNAAGASLMADYDALSEENGPYDAMKTVQEEVKTACPEFNAAILPEHQCGTVVGGIRGPLRDTGVTADVGVIKLLPGIAMVDSCTGSILLAGVTSPPLRLGADGTAILDPVDFPEEVFRVCGRGACSENTMIAAISPYAAIRPLQPLGSAGLSYECIHASVPQFQAR